MLLKNRTIIIAGAGGLLGQNITHSLLKEGANIVAADITEEKIRKSLDIYPDARVLISNLDITDEDSIENLISNAEKKWGTIDGAVNTSYPRSRNYGRKAMEVTYEDFCENLNMHLGGYFLFMRNCARYSLRKETEFSLVNLSSVYGNIAPRFDIYKGTNMTTPVEYAAIKSAIQGMSKYFGGLTKNSKFRVNTVSPGGIYDNQPENFTSAYRGYCRSKGMLAPKDITGAIKFLLSSQSEFIISQNIIIDDGFCL